jgi:hypothetical protein
MKVIKLNEQDFQRIIKRVVNEQRFDPDRYEETADYGYNRLVEYLQPLVDQGNIHSDIRNEILDLAQSYADDMWEEGARGGFADR